MGTHMWTGGGPPVSRRGRRMSLELPPHGVPPVGIPLTPPHKDSEFLQQQRRPQQQQLQQRSLGSPPPPPLPPPPPPRELSFFPYLPTPFSVAAAAAASVATISTARSSDMAIPKEMVSILIEA